MQINARAQETQMPTYACSTMVGRLSDQQRLKIVDSITAIHAEETGAPRYLVQVIFYEVGPRAHFIGGMPAPEGQIWIRADLRSGRTEAVKQRILERILSEVSEATGTPDERIWVYLCDIPASNIAEYGRVLPSPGEEAAWLAALPDALRTRLQSMA